jgi:hypothetical protein
MPKKCQKNAEKMPKNAEKMPKKCRKNFSALLCFALLCFALLCLCVLHFLKLIITVDIFYFHNHNLTSETNQAFPAALKITLAQPLLVL